jgi:hypothetical protein
MVCSWCHLAHTYTHTHTHTHIHTHTYTHTHTTCSTHTHAQNIHTTTHRYIEELVQAQVDSGIPSERIVVGGFSQGGCTFSQNDCRF